MRTAEKIIARPLFTHPGHGRNRTIAVISQACKSSTMEHDAEQVASDWVIFARYDANKAPDLVFANGWVLYDLVGENPHLAWDVIKRVISRYSERDYFSDSKTEAQKVVGNLAAGPLEDLLSAHGPVFIEAAEAEARSDRRMAWTLGGVWQLGMSNEIWARVQQAADHSYWSRPIK